MKDNGVGLDSEWSIPPFKISPSLARVVMALDWTVNGLYPHLIASSSPARVIIGVGEAREDWVGVGSENVVVMPIRTANASVMR